MEKIQEKANYCLNCPVKPCSKGCPLGNHIPDFIAQVKVGNIEKAYEILCETTVLSPICGRICPHLKQCQGSCVRGKMGESVRIGELEAMVGDYAIKHNIPIPKKEIKRKEKIAVIGAGPAGLTCAAFLAREGYLVTLMDKNEKLGGILTHGIPEFRLPEAVVQDTVKKICELGMEVITGVEFGVDKNLEEYTKNFDAVFIGIGANEASKMNIPGENLQGVYGGNGLLEKENHPEYVGKKVAIIGGGNVAMDAARTIRAKGALEVTVIYRRAEEQMPAEVKEIEEAKKEGVQFLFQTNLVEIHGEKEIKEIECVKTELIQKEGETRLVPVNIENSNFTIPMDYVVMAVGSEADKNITAKLGLELDKWGKVKIDENGRTSNEKVFAGGDIAGAKSTVAWAARSGRDAAYAIMEYLEK